MIHHFLGLAALVATGFCASLEQVDDFGDNPTDIDMYIYVPEKLAENPPVIVAIHECFSSASSYYERTEMPSFADANGFVLIYPGTTNMARCWDIQNPKTLTHGAGGDAAGIISMVNYALDKYSGDPAKVFVLGSSSGAMMTNVLAATYPDVFEAGAVYSGVAHACFAGAASATPVSWNQTCARGLQHTPEEWGDFVRNSYEGYTGKRPRMQIYHGFADWLVVPQCAAESLKQWSNVFDVPWSKNVTGEPDGYTQIIYGDGTQLQGFFGDGVGHTAPVQERRMLQFFGIL